MSGAKPQTRVGQIVGTHGVKGGLKVRVLTDFPERFEPGNTVFFNETPHKILRSNWHKDQVRIQVEGVDSMTQAEGLKWEYVTVPGTAEPKLDKDEYLDRDLVGMRVVTVDGREVGILEAVIHAPAQDLFQIGEVLIPTVKQFVKSIDLVGRQITVQLIPGMLPGEDAE